MALVTLAEAKTFLNIQDVATDAEVTALIAAITPIIERETGPVDARSVTSVVVSDGRAALPLTNITGITSITVLSSGATVSVTGISSDKSILRYANGTPLPSGELSVVYTVGLATVPANIKYGALEVLKLAWAAQVNEDLPAFLLSYRASAWFAPNQVSLGFA